MGTQGCHCIADQKKEDLNNEIDFNQKGNTNIFITNIDNNFGATQIDEKKGTECSMVKSSPINAKYRSCIYDSDNIERIQATHKGWFFRKKYNDTIYKELIKNRNEMIERIYNEYKNHNVNLAMKIFNISNDQKKDLIKDTLNSHNLTTTILLSKLTISSLSSSSSTFPKTLNTFYSGGVNINNIRHGYGTLLIEQGNMYIGFWINGDFTGYNTLITKNGTLYEGFFNNWKLTGSGIKKTLNNNFYEGEFNNFLREGQGTEETNDHIYKGQFKDDMKEGKGEVTYKKDNDHYKGEFKRNVIHGQGEYKWNNGNKYTGTFMNGKMEGKGRYEMNNGAIYEGEYKEGIREGKGKYQWSNGITFEGNFEKGKPKGKGKLKVGDIEYDVIFEQGKLKDEYKYILKGTI